ncbi:MAG TPA: hypothetical protein DCQ31_02885 [Bacteroidales bacterium]|nr:hypothetical protein [Bacteroidales bacterium]
MNKFANKASLFCIFAKDVNIKKLPTSDFMKTLVRTKLIVLLIIIIIISLAMLIYQQKYEKNKTNVFISGLISEKKFIFNNTLTFKQNELRKHIDDYTIWDELVDFHYTNDTVWAKGIFDEFVLNNFEIDAVFVCDTSGKLQFSNKLPLLDNLNLPIKNTNELGGKYIRSFQFYQLIDSQLVQFVGQRTYGTTDIKKEKPHGAYFVARIWSVSFIDKLKQLSDANVQIVPIKELKEAKSKNHGQAINNIELKNYKGEIIAYIVVTKDFTALEKIQQMSRVNELLRWGFIILILVLLIILLYRWVFNPLQRISNAMQDENPGHILKLLEQNNEFSRMSAMFIDFLNHKEELLAINDELRDSRDRLQLWNKQITDSIFYARRIQKAVFPDKELMQSYFKEYFLFFEPKNIVSGDFYWVKKIESKLYIAAADCTGHGVPGAFMSLLGLNFLTEITQNKPNASTNEILESLRTKIKNALNQNVNELKTRDGLNIALCIYDINLKKLQFSGAYHPLYLFRNNELMVLPADKMPVGMHKNETEFHTIETEIKPEDIIYLFSDGMIDQFGGADNRKFMGARFKALLQQIHTLPLEQQKIIIKKEFGTWKGEKQQLDDVLVFGFKLAV